MSASKFHPAFQDSTLFISARSPFARRVRIAMLESGVRFEEKVVDVFHPTPELLAANPLGRVPVVRLASGMTICESQLILDALYQAPLSLEMARWSGLFVGLCDRIVEQYLESLRPAAARDPEIFTDFERFFTGTLELAEAELASKRWLSGGDEPRQPDFDAGVALTYACLRYSSEWQKAFPSCSALMQRLEKRPSFERTRPPEA